MPGDYSEELEEQLTQVIFDANVEPWPLRFTIPARRYARAILDALSSAGRLVPEGSEVREEWGVRYTRRTDDEVFETKAEGREMAEGWVEYANARVAENPESWLLDASLMSRRRITTPWTPAEPAQERP